MNQPTRQLALNQPPIANVPKKTGRYFYAEGVAQKIPGMGNLTDKVNLIPCSQCCRAPRDHEQARPLPYRVRKSILRAFGSKYSAPFDYMKAAQAHLR